MADWQDEDWAWQDYLENGAETPAEEIARLTYYSLLIPWCPTHRNPWTPREEDRGTPFEVRAVGSFASYSEAVEWAASRLNGAPYSVVRYSVNEQGEPVATPAHLVRE